MELCPRCSSTVADGAHECPGCGAPAWRPASNGHAVAVTPAPVALVLPVPAAAPALGANPSARSIVVKLPPQQPEPASSSPALPMRSETVIPATPVAQRKPNQWAIGIGTVTSLLVVAVLVIALPARGAKRNAPAVVRATEADVQLDLRTLATAEETYLTTTTTYTTKREELESVGYEPVAAPTVTAFAGIHARTGYCLLGSAGGSAPWYLFDSEQGGLVNSSFVSQALARQACADHAISSYTKIA